MKWMRRFHSVSTHNARRHCNRLAMFAWAEKSSSSSKIFKRGANAANEYPVIDVTEISLICEFLFCYSRIQAKTANMEGWFWKLKYYSNILIFGIHIQYEDNDFAFKSVNDLKIRFEISFSVYQNIFIISHYSKSSFLRLMMILSAENRFEVQFLCFKHQS